MTNATHQAALILASKSPRRKDLLKQAAIPFEVMPSRVDESVIPITTPKAHVRLLAEAKARDVGTRFPEKWVLGADTEVVMNETVLGKPQDRDQARNMLNALSGKTHRVLTGYCLFCLSHNRSISDIVETKVQFRPLTEEEIAWYIDSQEPFDKAGGYAVQGLGAVLVRRIEGSYTNVVGLPICEVMEHLLQEGVIKR